MKEKIKAPGFVSFISSPAGRLLRIVLGLLLLSLAFNAANSFQRVIGIFGVVPLFTGLFDVCTLGPLFGGYFSGAKTRELLHEQRGVSYLGSKPASFSKA